MDNPNDVGDFFSRLVLEDRFVQTSAPDQFVQKVFGASADLMEKLISPAEHTQTLDAEADRLYTAMGQRPEVQRFVTDVFQVVVQAANGSLPGALLQTRLDLLKSRLRQGVSN